MFSPATNSVLDLATLYTFSTIFVYLKIRFSHVLSNREN